MAHTSVLSKMPLGHFFTRSSSGTLDREISAMYGQLEPTSAQSEPEFAPSIQETPTEVDQTGDFKIPGVVAVRGRTLRLRHSDTDSDTSCRGLAHMQKIGGSHLLVSDPKRWVIREAMKMGEAWTVPSAQKSARLSLTYDNGKVIGGKTSTGAFQMHDVVPANFRSGLFFHVEFRHGETDEWSSRFITCDVALRSNVNLLLNTIVIRFYYGLLNQPLTYYNG